VVVLDFFATWCGPCRRGLPVLQQFSDWATGQGKPVRVFAVNIWQREAGDAARREAVQKFWSGQKLTVPVLMDYKDALGTAYGFTSIPQTVVIGPDGRVANIHNGFSPAMLEMLKSDMAKALARAN
jgi:thiol-disulfide isomerase/thioredoxin